MRIALFVTCLADTLFPDVGKSTTALLERLGHRVEFPEAQTCCGQMHVNTGYQREALPLVRRYVETFEHYDVVVAPSGSCVGSIRHQHAMVARRYGDEKLARRAEAVAGRAFELSQLLIDVLRMGGGLSRLRAGVRTVHLAEILASTQDAIFEPKGRGAAWTEERGTSGGRRRRSEGGVGRRAGPRRRAENRA